ncbi:MAG: DUF2726 domain-containing protein [Planctomycetia bacterium]|nr:DUF2726 domain-containing protein [Planctomycetia bacterium]
MGIFITPLVILFCIVAVIFAVLLIVWIQIPGKSKKQTGMVTYRAVSVLSPVENLFYQSLIQAVPKGFYLFPKLGLWAIVRNNESSGWPKISQKHLDFVITNKDFQPVLVIELDDKSHKSYGSTKRDETKNQILESAKIPILRVGVKKGYAVKDLEDLVLPFCTPT